MGSWGCWLSLLSSTFGVSGYDSATSVSSDEGSVSGELTGSVVTSSTDSGSEFSASDDSVAGYSGSGLEASG